MCDVLQQQSRRKGETASEVTLWRIKLLTLHNHHDNCCLLLNVFHSVIMLNYVILL